MFSGIFLAAGPGSRMGRETLDKPKCLLSLGGKTLLDWGIEAMKGAGINDLVVVGGYQKDKLSNSSYTLLDNPDWRNTNMVVTLMAADAYLESSPCVVAYSDIVFTPEYVTKLIDCKNEFAITYDTLWEPLWSLRMTDPLSDLETFEEENGILKSIGEKPKSLTEVGGQYMGLIKTSPKTWGIIKEAILSLPGALQKTLDMTSLLRILLRNKMKIGAVSGKGKWCEVDTFTDMQVYEKTLSEIDEKKIFWSHDWRWKPRFT